MDVKDIEISMDESPRLFVAISLKFTANQGVKGVLLQRYPPHSLHLKATLGGKRNHLQNPYTGTRFAHLT